MAFCYLYAALEYVRAVYGLDMFFVDVFLFLSGHGAERITMEDGRCGRNRSPT